MANAAVASTAKAAGGGKGDRQAGDRQAGSRVSEHVDCASMAVLKGQRGALIAMLNQSPTRVTHCLITKQSRGAQCVLKHKLIAARPLLRCLAVYFATAERAQSAIKRGRLEPGPTQQALTSHHKQCESSVLHRGVHVLSQGWDFGSFVAGTVKRRVVQCVRGMVPVNCDATRGQATF